MHSSRSNELQCCLNRTITNDIIMTITKIYKMISHYFYNKMYSVCTMQCAQQNIFDLCNTIFTTKCIQFIQYNIYVLKRIENFLDSLYRKGLNEILEGILEVINPNGSWKSSIHFNT